MVSSTTKDNGAHSGAGTTPYEDALEPYRRLENAFKQYGRGELPLAALLSQIDTTAADRRRVPVSTWLDTPDAAFYDDVVATMQRGLATANEAEVQCTRVIDDTITVELDSPGDPRPPVNAPDPAQRSSGHGRPTALSRVSRGGARAAFAAMAAVALAYTYLEYSTISEAPPADALVAAERMPPSSPPTAAMPGGVTLVEPRGQEPEAASGPTVDVSQAPALQRGLEPKRDPVPEAVEAGEDTRRRRADLLALPGDPEEGAAANAIQPKTKRSPARQALRRAQETRRKSEPTKAASIADEERSPTAPRRKTSPSLQAKAQQQLAAQRSTGRTTDEGTPMVGKAQTAKRRAQLGLPERARTAALIKPKVQRVGIAAPRGPARPSSGVKANVQARAGDRPTIARFEEFIRVMGVP